MSEQAFLESIREDPDDDSPRLIFADWLEERGNPRGEFIRVQCELARLPEDDERRPELLARELRLLHEHSKGWAAPLRAWVKRWEYRRGFIDTVKLSSEMFLQHADELFQAAPIRQVQLTGIADHAQELAACPHLKNLSGSRVRSPLTLRTLLNSPHLDGLRTLELRDYGLHGTGMHMLATHPRLQQVESLDLRNNRFLPEDVKVLVKSKQLGALRRLRLSGCRIEASSQVVGIVSRLGFLDLGNCNNVGPETLRLFTMLKRTVPLTTLLLEHNSIGAGADATEHFREWIGSEQLASLHTLDLSTCLMDTPRVEFLAGRSWLSALVNLGLRNNSLGRKGASALAASDRLKKLQRLELANTNLHDDGVTALARGKGLPLLAALNLRGNHITARGAEALAEWPLSDRLYWLDLRQNKLGDEGAAALLKAAWPRLAWLDLAATAFTLP